MTVEVRAEMIREAAVLAALEPAWSALWRRTGTTPFQGPAWLIPWWRHFGPGELMTAAAWQGERLVGLAPFYLEDGALGRRLLPVGISLSDYIDVLVDPEAAEAAGAALVVAMAREPGWEVWELEEAPPGAAALRLPLPEGCEEAVVDQSACPLLVVPPGAQSVTDFVSLRKRKQIRLARNRAARRDAVGVERAAGPAALDALEWLIALHGARWRSRGEAGLFADERVARFQREALPRLDAAGLVRLYVLRVGADVVGAYYGFVHEGRAYAYMTGFDPAHSFESPGVTLLAHAIDAALAEGCTEFHFLCGREPYKHGWGPQDRWNRKRSFRREPRRA